MRRHRLDRAYQYVNDLVEFQLKRGGEEYACKSLCDLAIKAKSLGLFGLQLELTERSIRLRPHDGFSWAQYADALLRNNELIKALSAYEQAITLRPDVEPQTGRAEVLKAQNRLDEALQAYESVIQQFPGDVVARNGRASVLAGLELWEEALASLPETPPVTQQDWIAYHIRGMILLRSDRFAESIKILETGARLCPSPSQRPYFQTALVVARLQQRAYSDAEDALKEIEAPSLSYPLTVLRFHTFGAQGKIDLAREASERLRPVANHPGFREVSAELERRYIERSQPQHSDSWLIQSEIKLLLAA